MEWFEKAKGSGTQNLQIHPSGVSSLTSTHETFVCVLLTYATLIYPDNIPDTNAHKSEPPAPDHPQHFIIWGIRLKHVCSDRWTSDQHLQLGKYNFVELYLSTSRSTGLGRRRNRHCQTLVSMPRRAGTRHRTTSAAFGNKHSSYRQDICFSDLLRQVSIAATIRCCCSWPHPLSSATELCKKYINNQISDPTLWFGDGSEPVQRYSEPRG